MLLINSLEEIDSILRKNKLVLIYFSSFDCNVCITLKPKIIQLLETFPEIVSCYVDIKKFPQVSGFYSVFTMPTIIIFAEGKETFRENRYINLSLFSQKIERYYKMIFEI